MRILFLHGLASSGAYKLSDMLRIILKADVIAPDLPIHPGAALSLLRDISLQERPDVVVGLSWGGFLALQLGFPRTVVINPNLHVSRLLRQFMGPVEYLSPRKDGETHFFISEALCLEYEQLEASGFRALSPLGLFATGDELIRCGEEFDQLYPGCAKKYPGKHLPTFPEVKNHLAPAIREYLEGR